MAANFWGSSHAKGLIPRSEALAGNPKDQAPLPGGAGLTLEEVQAIKSHFTLFIADIAKQCRPARQRVVATAVVYFRRLYVRRSFSDYDPRLAAPACLYLASKAEETTIQAKHIVALVKKKYGAARNAGSPLPPELSYSLEVPDLLGMETRLLEELDFHLVVYHPYRPLQQLLQGASLPRADQQLAFCWGLLNDVYRTDLVLVHPPHIIALGVIYASCVLRGVEEEGRAWFDGLRGVDMEAVLGVALELFTLYEAAQQGGGGLDSEQCARLLQRCTAGGAACCVWLGARDWGDRDKGQFPIPPPRGEQLGLERELENAHGVGTVGVRAGR